MPRYAERAAADGEGENGIQKEIPSHHRVRKKSQMAIFWASPFCCAEKMPCCNKKA
jgi:hypothetical protein